MKKRNPLVGKISQVFVFFVVFFLVLAGSLQKTIGLGDKSIQDQKETLQTLEGLNSLLSISDKILNHYRILIASEGKNGLDILTKIEGEKTLYQKEWESFKAKLDAESIKTIEENFKKFNSLAEITSLSLLSGSATKEQLDEFEVSTTTLETSFLNIRENINAKNEARNIENANSLSTLRIIGTTIVIIALLLFLILGIYLIKAVKKVIKEEAEELENNLKSVISSLESNYSSLHNISNGLESSQNLLSETYKDQSLATEKAVVAINEISRMVKHTADQSNECKNVADNTSERTNEGRDVSHNLTNELHEVSNSSKELQSIIDMFDNIAKQIEMINEIVEQTKLLSFNASVEAARAGESGKGFAVVATEIGNLAKKSGESSHQINDLLRNSKTKLRTIVHDISAKVDGLGTVSEQSVAVFNQIFSMNSSLLDSVTKITMACNEQSEAILETESAMSEITSKNSQGVSNLSAVNDNTTTLVSEMNKMKEVINELGKVINSKKSE